MARQVASTDERLDRLAREEVGITDRILAEKQASRQRLEKLESRRQAKRDAIHAHLGALTSKTQTVYTPSGYKIHREQTESVEFPFHEAAAVAALKRAGLHTCLQRKVVWTVRKNRVKELASRLKRLRSIKIVSDVSLSVKPPVEGNS